ncbi:hypothetical protein N7G274_010026 [Stereocaulon virgatum]|uniref:BD-FAE-like domain-containing protein n=1 Tax=Stereocaulon virgatum TaxID=373712 RepID=A0ABR4A1G6_9LECA
METVTYSRIGSLDIQLDLYIPHNLPLGRRPAIVHFHGGGMIGGSRKSLFFLQWLRDAALKHGILFISADHRLLIPSTAFDIIEDVKTLFTFLADPCFSRTLLPKGTSLDATRIAVSGESGGGYAARAAGIYAQPRPAAIFLQYAMGGQLLDDHWLAVKEGPLEPSVENITAEAFSELLTQPQEPISYDLIPSPGDKAPNGASRRCMLLLLWWETGELLDYILGAKISKSLRSILPNERADAVPAALRLAILQTQITSDFPPTFLYHGKDDTLILPAESELTYNQLRSLGIEAELHLLEGASHTLMDAHDPSRLTAGAEVLRGKAFEFLLSKLL